jgi:hypothetical protein
MEEQVWRTYFQDTVGLEVEEVELLLLEELILAGNWWRNWWSRFSKFNFRITSNLCRWSRWRRTYFWQESVLEDQVWWRRSWSGTVPSMEQWNS